MKKQIDLIKEQAEKLLSFESESGNSIRWLWDKTLRMVRNVDIICEFDELSEMGEQIDRFSLKAAAYFVNAGQAENFRRGDIQTGYISDSGNKEICELSAEIAKTALSGPLEKAKIQKICKIIEESGSNFTTMTEAMVLSDACNLEDMGATGIFHGSRRSFFTGKCINDAIASWRRKIEYQYWQARLKESFRLEGVRRIAQERLARANDFMIQLERENSGADLEELVEGTSPFELGESGKSYQQS